MDIEGEVIEQPEVEEAEVEAQEAEQPEEQAEDAGLVLEIAEEPEEEPEHISELRRRYRDQQRELKELRARSGGEAVQQAEALPPEPQPEDFDYDMDEFKVAHKAWVLKSVEHEKRQEEAKAMQAKAQQRWENRLAYYDEAKEKLGAQDYDEAETTVAEILSAPFPGILASDVRLGIIKQGAKDPAALVYALAKNPAKARELAAIEDPVEFAWKASALENGMKVVRGKAPPPERKIAGGVPGVAGALDDTLERLREKAAQTGDYSEVARYKRSLKG